jgi:hypothetical protein
VLVDLRLPPRERSVLVAQKRGRLLPASRRSCVGPDSRRPAPPSRRSGRAGGGMQALSQPNSCRRRRRPLPPVAAQLAAPPATEGTLALRGRRSRYSGSLPGRPASSPRPLSSAPRLGSTQRAPRPPVEPDTYHRSCRSIRPNNYRSGGENRGCKLMQTRVFKESEPVALLLLSTWFLIHLGGSQLPS